MTQPTYAELLEEISVSVTLTPNDAAFLSAILGSYIYQNKLENNKVCRDLMERLNPKAGC